VKHGVGKCAVRCVVGLVHGVVFFSTCPARVSRSLSESVTVVDSFLISCFLFYNFTNWVARCGRTNSNPQPSKIPERKVRRDHRHTATVKNVTFSMF
jgi:hypothetical protein